MLDGLVVAISGGSGKIGSSFTKAILENNGKVIIGDTNLTNSKKILNKFGDQNVFLFSKDLTKERNIEDFLSNGIKKFNKIDAAVHCCYPISSKWGIRFEDLTLKNLNKDLSLQLGGAIIFSKVFMKYFSKKKSGNLIHISSIQGISAPKFDHYKSTKMISPVEYSAIKSSIISITKYLAKYYSGKNIRVNSISPGGIYDNQPKSFVKKYNSICNIKGMLDPQDLNGALIFLLSNNSKFINGQNLIIDDGWSL